MEAESERSREDRDSDAAAAIASERRWRAAVHFLTPAAIGAVLLGAITAVRVAFVVLSGRSEAVGMAILAVGVAALAGAVGGLVYAALGRPLRRLGRVGPYLAGFVTVGGYLAAVVSAISRIDPNQRFNIGDRAGQIAFVACTLVFGSWLGREFAKDEAEPSGRARERAT